MLSELDKFPEMWNAMHDLSATVELLVSVYFKMIRAN